MQLYRYDHREQASGTGGVGVCHVKDSHHSLFRELLLHVAVQESDLPADHVLTFDSGGVSQDGAIDMLVC